MFERHGTPEKITEIIKIEGKKIVCECGEELGIKKDNQLILNINQFDKQKQIVKCAKCNKEKNVTEL